VRTWRPRDGRKTSLLTRSWFICPDECDRPDERHENARVPQPGHRLPVERLGARVHRVHAQAPPRAQAQGRRRGAGKGAKRPGVTSRQKRPKRQRLDTHEGATGQKVKNRANRRPRKGE
jgi:hypothetical protein